MINYLKYLQALAFRHEAQKANHLLALIQKAGGGVPKDSPLPHEDKMIAIMLPFFVNAFNSHFNALKETRILEVFFNMAYQPGMDEAEITQRMNAVIRLLSNPFDILWAKGKEAEYANITQEMYALAREVAAEQVGVPQSEHNERDTRAEQHHTAIATIWTSLGITQTVMPTAVTRLIRDSLRQGRDTIEARHYFMDNLPIVVAASALVYYGGLSSIAINGARNMGRVFEFQNLGVTYATWNTAADELVCPVCDALDGTTYRVEDAAMAMERMLDASTAEELVEAHPFVTGIDTATNEFKLASGGRISVDAEAEVLAMFGIVPPVHAHCYSKNTEVMTKEGWKLFSEVTGKEHFLSLNPETRDLEWTTASKTIQHYAKEIYILSNKKKTFYQEVSKEHPWFGYSRIDRGKKGRILEVSRPQNISEIPSEFKFYLSSEWTGKDVPEIKIGKHVFPMEDFCRFLGYYLAEGSVTKRGKKWYQIAVTQTKFLDKMYEDISKLSSLTVNLGKDKIYINDADLGKYLLPLGYSYQKYIPEEIKTLPSKYLEILYQAFWLGDGFTSGKVEPQFCTWKGAQFRSNRTVCTSSPRLMSDLCEILIKMHKGVRVTHAFRKGITQTFRNGDYTINHDIYNIAEVHSHYRLWNNITVEVKPYNDFVYDVELEKNHILLTKCKGRVVWGSNCRCEIDVLHIVS